MRDFYSDLEMQAGVSRLTGDGKLAVERILNKRMAKDTGSDVGADEAYGRSNKPVWLT